MKKNTKPGTALLLAMCCCTHTLHATNLTQATIVYNTRDHHLARQMAGVLAEDIERVSGTIDIPIPTSYLTRGADSVSVCISVVPMWPRADSTEDNTAIARCLARKL